MLEVLLQGNLALKEAMDEQTPVRVCRAAGSIERDGINFRQYAYEGLYLVRDMALCAPWLPFLTHLCTGCRLRHATDDYPAWPAHVLHVIAAFLHGLLVKVDMQ